MRAGLFRVAVVWVIALAIGQTGCAAIMQQAPKKNRAPREIPICSTSQGGVALDGILAVLLGAGALVALANDEPAAGLALGGVGGIYTWSAVSGHQSAGACEEALEDYRAEMAVAGPGTETARAPAATAPPRPSAPVEASAAPVPRPAGPPATAAAPAGDDDPSPPPPEEEPPVADEPQPPEAKPATRPVPVPTRRDWSDFWVEVKN